MERESAWKKYDEAQLREVQQLSDEYREFISDCKTERECVARCIALARERGYQDLEELIDRNLPLQPGDKVYVSCMDKTLALFNVGRDPLEEGLAILGAHVDSPRIDVKQEPLYEAESAAYFDTHYYGGVKKYQWVTIPLAIRGLAVKKDGERVKINIGDHPGDPVFCISDLLIHLSQEQLEKKGRKVVEAEDLDLLVGSIPLAGEEKDAVKKNVLRLLEEEYGLEEADLTSAELELVPAGEAREAGLDRSLILGYGQDDRVCAYTSLLAMLEVDDVQRTTCCFLCDKEEIGSVGATGARSRFFENAVAELLERAGQLTPLALSRCLRRSRMLSSDVSAAYDPLYAAAFNKRSACYLGKGMVFNKFTGSGGKSGSNDANPEFIADIRRVLDEAGVSYQNAELGKVDLGGGGTIAYIFALLGMEVVDSGVAVLSMHAPWELTSKADLYEAKRGYAAFLRHIFD
ncbi:MAG: aminopeptidase [Firmicutes bacterium]|nr:aminopeptidase [Bacillota bacterium]